MNVGDNDKQCLNTHITDFYNLYSVCSVNIIIFKYTCSFHPSLDYVLVSSPNGHYVKESRRIRVNPVYEKAVIEHTQMI